MLLFFSRSSLGKFSLIAEVEICIKTQSSGNQLPEFHGSLSQPIVKFCQDLGRCGIINGIDVELRMKESLMITVAPVIYGPSIRYLCRSGSLARLGDLRPGFWKIEKGPTY